ncbi:hypothetical protein DY000_02029654 [Brassica cretica]|uniref:Uncharacterized protein n=1 Tax=Brassica cretica TaxID=69181 RepID=A0ABQ7DPI1_BRACR|nr:hypothetical protein DY000_02029654 [Brassica cretica]
MVVVTQYHNLSYDCLFSAVSDTIIKDDKILRWLRLGKDIQLHLPPVRVMNLVVMLHSHHCEASFGRGTPTPFTTTTVTYTKANMMEMTVEMKMMYDGGDGGDIDVDGIRNTVNAIRLPLRMYIMLSSLVSFPVSPPPFVAVSNTILCGLNHCSLTSYKLMESYYGMSLSSENERDVVEISEEDTEEEFEVKECTNDESHVHVDTSITVYMWPSVSGVHVNTELSCTCR